MYRPPAPPLSPPPPPPPQEPTPGDVIPAHELLALFYARLHRLLALQGGVALQPDTGETRYARRLIGWSIYSIYDDLLALGEPVAGLNTVIGVKTERPTEVGNGS